MKTAQEIEAGLTNFYGTEAYHRLSALFPRVVATDGVKWLAENAECFWLMDIIASHQAEIKQKRSIQGLQVWQLTKKQGGGCQVVCTNGNKRAREVVHQDVPMTDFPLGTIRLYCEPQEDLQVILLPGEH